MSLLQSKQMRTHDRRCSLTCLISTDTQPEDQAQLIRDLWPVYIPKLLKDKVACPPSKRVVPDNLDDMFNWAYVKHIPNSVDNTRKHMLVYVDEDSFDLDVATEVAISIQGFVHQADIGPVGNWTRFVSDFVAAQPTDLYSPLAMKEML